MALLGRAAPPKQASTAIRYILAGFAVIIAVLAACLVVLAAHWPFSRAGITHRIKSALDVNLSIKKFHETYFPPGCVAEQVAITKSGAPPFATFQKVTIETSYPGLFAHHIRRMVLDGAVLNTLPPLQGGGKSDGVVIDALAAKDSILQAGNMRFIFHRLELRDLGAGRRIGIDIEAHIPKPSGEVAVQAQVGPLRGGALDQTPLSGSFIVNNADLGTFQNLGGMVSGKGKFDGVLSRINVTGSTDTPDFETNRNGHEHRLTANFTAVVNGMNGDTSLPKLSAKLDNTEINGTASIRQVGTNPAKTIALDVAQGRGRVEDLLLLFIKSPRSPMVGAIDFKTRVVVPPEHRSFTKRVRLDGAFHITGADFTNRNTQNGVNSLSEHAEGEPKEAPERVTELLSGRISLRNGIARFFDTRINIPGANAELAGTYGLTAPYRVDLRGKMAMAADLSHATTGVKSFFLKFLDPFYKRRHAGAVVPVSITGTYDHPQFQMLMVKTNSAG